MTGRKLLLIFTSVIVTVFPCMSPVKADIIILLDGRAIEGEILKQTRREITLKTRAGITVTVERDEIERIVTMEDLKKEYAKKRAKVGKDDEFAHLELAKWCRKNGLKDEYRKELEEVLRINPENADAKKQLDLIKGELAGDIKKKIGKESERPVKKKPEKKETPPEKPDEEPGEAHETASADAPEVKDDDDGILEPLDGKKLSGGSGSSKKPSGTKKILKKALAFIASKQEAGGYWPTEMSHLNGQVVMTSLCGLALMAGGSTPARGPYANEVYLAVKFVKENIARVGEFDNVPINGGNMNQQNWRWGIGGIFLAEAYAKYKDPAIKAALQEAVKLLEDSQEASGGWAHGTGGLNALGYLELEVVSNWALSALGMAKSAGCKVKSSKMKKGLDYIARCTNRIGGVAYSTRPGQVGHGCPGRTGGAMLAYSLCRNKPSNFHMLAGYLAKKMDQAPSGHASPVMHIMGAGLGAIQTSKELWDQFAAKLLPVVVRHANPNGSFRTIINPREGDTDTENGPYYTAGICALMLALDEGRLKTLSGKYSRGGSGSSDFDKHQKIIEANKEARAKELAEKEKESETDTPDEEEEKVRDSR